jgi:hypothetical protein
MKFTPVKFQATLASAEVALMPIYFLGDLNENYHSTQKQTVFRMESSDQVIGLQYSWCFYIITLKNLKN